MAASNRTLGAILLLATPVTGTSLKEKEASSGREEASLGLYLAKCDAADVAQKWAGETFSNGNYSPVMNVKTGQCISSTASSDPAMLEDCGGSDWLYNSTNSTLSNVEQNLCLDAHGGRGPEIMLYACHVVEDFDHFHQVRSERATN